VLTYTGWFVGFVMFLCGIFVLVNPHMQDKSGNGIGFLIGGIVLLLLSIPTFLK
jgi:hypothetical protein